MVHCANQAQHVLEYHVNTPFNKNTTASYALQHGRDASMISQRNREELIQQIPSEILQVQFSQNPV